MKESDIFRLGHILDAAREALSFAAGYKREDLCTNRMLMHTLVREIEIIGEAASKLSLEAREQIPNIEWPNVGHFITREPPKYVLKILKGVELSEEDFEQIKVPRMMIVREQYESQVRGNAN
jgi:hypothetical protein